MTKNQKPAANHMSTTSNSLYVFLPSLHGMHQPAKDYSDGLPPIDHLESPQRINALLKGIQASRSIELIETSELAHDAVYKIHDEDYVDFLIAISKNISQDQEYIPPCFGRNLLQAPIQFRGGMYCREIGTPIGAGTVTAALNSAATAKLAAEHLLTTRRNCLALCRPPGHHAGRRRYGGYSYFNNAYIAANTLTQYGKCAVLDVDYHMGEGSAEFACEKAPYFSLHANPYTNYPYLDTATALPSQHIELINLEAGTQSEIYLKHLATLCKKISHLSPDFLILSLGFDTLNSDILQDDPIHLVSEDYGQIAHIISCLNIPVLVILEGGYAINELHHCAKAFAEKI